MAETKKVGRPKSVPVEDTIINETDVERLEMSRASGITTIDDITSQWRDTLTKMESLGGITQAYNKDTSKIVAVKDKWNKLNPFLQNQRLKSVYTQSKQYAKANISEFLADPANNETQLRSLGWANSSSQQIYYNILRRSADIPIYNYFKIPDFLEGEGAYSKDAFKFEDKLSDE